MGNTAAMPETAETEIDDESKELKIIKETISDVSKRLRSLPGVYGFAFTISCENGATLGLEMMPHTSFGQLLSTSLELIENLSNLQKRAILDFKKHIPGTAEVMTESHHE